VDIFDFGLSPLRGNVIAKITVKIMLEISENQFYPFHPCSQLASHSEATKMSNLFNLRPKGNPADSTLYEDCLKKVIANYDRTPKDSTTDGGYASLNNLKIAQALGIQNIVFNKAKGKMQNIAKTKILGTRLEKWRSGIEANISNLLRGSNIRRCNWEGLAHFKQKVLLSVLAYNIRVMAAHVTKPPMA
jgi:Transposase DDE domain